MSDGLSSQLQAHLGELGCLAGTRRPGDDDDLIFCDGTQDFFTPGTDREILGIGNRQIGHEYLNINADNPYV